MSKLPVPEIYVLAEFVNFGQTYYWNLAPKDYSTALKIGESQELYCLRLIFFFRNLKFVFLQQNFETVGERKLFNIIG
jgi:hypothetical protein